MPTLTAVRGWLTVLGALLASGCFLVLLCANGHQPWRALRGTFAWLSIGMVCAAIGAFTGRYVWTMLAPAAVDTGLALFLIVAHRAIRRREA